MLVALWMQRVVLMVSMMEGRETTFSAVFIIRCRVLWSETVLVPNQAMMQRLRMLSTVPL